MAQYLVLAIDKDGNTLESFSAIANGPNEAEIKFNACAAFAGYKQEDIMQLLAYKLERIFTYGEEDVINGG